MKNLNQKLAHTYSQLLKNLCVFPSDQRDYFKWLRFYLDFCDKYKHAPRNQESLQEFVKKLHSKSQPIEQQEQASKAIQFYYSIFETRKGSIENSQPSQKKGNALLSRRDEAAPLLLDYVKAKDGSELNKLSAISLLVEIDEKLVTGDLLSNLSPDAIEKAKCIQSKKINWRYIGKDPCMVPGISPEDQLILNRRKQLLNSR